MADCDIAKPISLKDPPAPLCRRPKEISFASDYWLWARHGWARQQGGGRLWKVRRTMNNENMNRGEGRRTIRWLIVKVVALLCVTSWAGFLVGASMGLDGDMWTLVVIAAAVTGEGLIWALAWALGLTLVETRKVLIGRIVAGWKTLVGRR
jgi:hypothetical protein